MLEPVNAFTRWLEFVNGQSSMAAVLELLEMTAYEYLMFQGVLRSKRNPVGEAHRPTTFPLPLLVEIADFEQFEVMLAKYRPHLLELFAAAATNRTLSRIYVV